ncbi:MAG: thiamine phosphate synthase [Acidimicrobiales bacterium]
MTLGRLHVIVDTVDLARAAIDGGAPVVQVRLKAGSDRQRFGVASVIAELCRHAGTLCIVNDRADIAVAVGAGGTHVGSDDLPVPAVRNLVGAAYVVGATARDPATARRLEADGATYLGVGPTFGTSSKPGLPSSLGLDGLRAVVDAVSIPVIAIAGVTANRISGVLAAGAHGVAVVGAVAHASDPRQATADLLAALREPVP